MPLDDLIHFSMTGKKALEIVRNENFWFFLYYRHLMPSPLYLDIQHNTLIDPPCASWYYMYLEQLWVQYIGLLYMNTSDMSYLHRTLSRAVDGKWQLIEESPRASFGPFNASTTPLVYCHHLGFKESRQNAQLEQDEVTGTFNWFGPLSNPDFSSLLPPLATSPRSHEEEFNLIAASQMKEWSHLTLGEESANQRRLDDWFISGAHSLIKALTSSIAHLGSFHDFWRECSQQTAENFALKIISGNLPYSEPLAKASLDESMKNISLDAENGDSSLFPSIVDSIIKLMKLGDPTLHLPLINLPNRFFVCSNIITTEYAIEHHHALVVLSLNRLFVVTRKFVVYEGAFENSPSEAISSLLSAIGESFHKEGV
jgi:hypothetical protein